jgi:hypothetical protein
MKCRQKIKMKIEKIPKIKNNKNEKTMEIGKK